MTDLRASHLATLVATGTGPHPSARTPKGPSARTASLGPDRAFGPRQTLGTQRASVAETGWPVGVVDDGIYGTLRHAQAAVVAGVGIDREQPEERVGLGQRSAGTGVFASATPDALVLENPQAHGYTTAGSGAL